MRSSVNTNITKPLQEVLTRQNLWQTSHLSTLFCNESVSQNLQNSTLQKKGSKICISINSINNLPKLKTQNQVHLLGLNTQETKCVFEKENCTESYEKSHNLSNGKKEKDDEYSDLHPDQSDLHNQGGTANIKKNKQVVTDSNVCIIEQCKRESTNLVRGKSAPPCSDQHLHQINNINENSKIYVLKNPRELEYDSKNNTTNYIQNKKLQQICSLKANINTEESLSNTPYFKNEKRFRPNTLRLKDSFIESCLGKTFKHMPASKCNVYSTSTFSSEDQNERRKTEHINHLQLNKEKSDSPNSTVLNNYALNPKIAPDVLLKPTLLPQKEFLYNVRSDDKESGFQTFVRSVDAPLTNDFIKTDKELLNQPDQLIKDKTDTQQCNVTIFTATSKVNSPNIETTGKEIAHTNELKLNESKCEEATKNSKLLADCKTTNNTNQFSTTNEIQTDLLNQYQNNLESSQNTSINNNVFYILSKLTSEINKNSTNGPSAARELPVDSLKQCQKNSKLFQKTDLKQNEPCIPPKRPSDVIANSTIQTTARDHQKGSIEQQQINSELLQNINIKWNEPLFPSKQPTEVTGNSNPQNFTAKEVQVDPLKIVNNKSELTPKTNTKQEESYSQPGQPSEVNKNNYSQPSTVKDLQTDSLKLCQNINDFHQKTDLKRNEPYLPSGHLSENKKINIFQSFTGREFQTDPFKTSLNSNELTNKTNTKWSESFHQCRQPSETNSNGTLQNYTARELQTDSLKTSQNNTELSQKTEKRYNESYSRPRQPSEINPNNIHQFYMTRDNQINSLKLSHNNKLSQKNNIKREESFLSRDRLSEVNTNSTLQSLAARELQTDSFKTCQNNSELTITKRSESNHQCRQPSNSNGNNTNQPSTARELQKNSLKVYQSNNEYSQKSNTKQNEPQGQPFEINRNRDSLVEMVNDNVHSSNDHINFKCFKDNTSNEHNLALKQTIYEKIENVTNNNLKLNDEKKRNIESGNSLIVNNIIDDCSAKLNGNFIKESKEITSDIKFPGINPPSFFATLGYEKPNTITTNKSNELSKIPNNCSIKEEVFHNLPTKQSEQETFDPKILNKIKAPAIYQQFSNFLKESLVCSSSKSPTLCCSSKREAGNLQDTKISKVSTQKCADTNKNIIAKQSTHTLNQPFKENSVTSSQWEVQASQMNPDKLTVMLKEHKMLLEMLLDKVNSKIIESNNYPKIMINQDDHKISHLRSDKYNESASEVLKQIWQQTLETQEKLKRLQIRNQTHIISQQSKTRDTCLKDKHIYQNKKSSQFFTLKKKQLEKKQPERDIQAPGDQIGEIRYTAEKKAGKRFRRITSMMTTPSKSFMQSNTIDLLDGTQLANYDYSPLKQMLNQHKIKSFNNMLISNYNQIKNTNELNNNKVNFKKMSYSSFLKKRENNEIKAKQKGENKKVDKITLRKNNLSHKEVVRRRHLGGKNILKTTLMTSMQKCRISSSNKFDSKNIVKKSKYEGEQKENWLRDKNIKNVITLSKGIAFQSFKRKYHQSSKQTIKKKIIKTMSYRPVIQVFHPLSKTSNRNNHLDTKLNFVTQTRSSSDLKRSYLENRMYCTSDSLINDSKNYKLGKISEYNLVKNDLNTPFYKNKRQLKNNQLKRKDDNTRKTIEYLNSLSKKVSKSESLASFSKPTLIKTMNLPIKSPSISESTALLKTKQASFIKYEMSDFAKKNNSKLASENKKVSRDYYLKKMIDCDNFSSMQKLTNIGNRENKSVLQRAPEGFLMNSELPLTLASKQCQRLKEDRLYINPHDLTQQSTQLPMRKRDLLKLIKPSLLSLRSLFHDSPATLSNNIQNQVLSTIEKDEESTIKSNEPESSPLSGSTTESTSSKQKSNKYVTRETLKSLTDKTINSINLSWNNVTKRVKQIMISQLSNEKSAICSASSIRDGMVNTSNEQCNNNIFNTPTKSLYRTENIQETVSPIEEQKMSNIESNGNENHRKVVLPRFMEKKSKNY